MTGILIAILVIQSIALLINLTHYGIAQQHLELAKRTNSLTNTMFGETPT